MYDPIGITTTLESPEPSRPVVNAYADAWEPSSWQAEALLEQATTALRQGVEAASRVHALEVLRRTLIQEVLTTPAPEAVSPFTQRLTLYSGLIGTLCKELSSIAPIGPVTDATDSLKGQESESSSPQSEKNSSPSEAHYADLSGTAEPRSGSVVLDEDGDAWQRTYYGWKCVQSGYEEWSWERLANFFRLRIIYLARYSD